MIPKIRFGLVKVSFYSKIWQMYNNGEITLKEFEVIKNKYDKIVK